jgi:hypothetical protein
MKLMLERAFHVRCSFNEWFWKHGLPPTLMSHDRHLRPTAPLVVMIKEPVHQNVSLFRHWQRTRPDLLGSKDFSQFIRSELIVHDNSFGGKGPKYLFPTPTDYWNAFYFSYLHWEDVAETSQIVRLDHLETRIAQTLALLERRFSLTDRPNFLPEIPSNKVRPSPDGRPVQLEPVEQQSNEFEISRIDRDFIESRVSRAVFESLFAT